MIIENSNQKQVKEPTYSITLYDGEFFEPSMDISSSEELSMTEQTKIEHNLKSERPVVAISLPIDAKVPDVTFPYLDTRKPLQPYKDIHDLICNFESDLKKIAILGKKFYAEDAYFQKKEQARAVYALSKLLGVYQKYFKNASQKKYEALMHSLRMKFQVSKNSKTTAFHLLSRQFRNNDTKQASADAKILNFAEKMGIDENTFAQWVSECGGLSKARDMSVADAKISKNEGKTASVKKKNPKAVFKKMNDAFQDLIREKQAHKVFSISESEMPEMFGVVKPWNGQSVGMLGVYVSKGNLHFYQLLEYVPKFGEHQTEVPDAAEE